MIEIVIVRTRQVQPQSSLYFLGYDAFSLSNNLSQNCAMAASPASYEVFISYDSRDPPTVEPIAQALRQRNLAAFLERCI